MSEFANRREYPMPGGYKAEFVLDGSRLECQWSPKVPKGKWARRVRAHYQAARNDFLGSLDVVCMVVEL